MNEQSDVKTSEEPIGTSEGNKALVVSAKQTSDLFKLDIDCFEEVFDYLLLRELVAVSLTCKRLQQIAGQCFRLNYAASVRLSSVPCTQRFFGPFIRKLAIHSTKNFHHFLDIHSKFRRLRRLEVSSIEINAAKMVPMTTILSKLEHLRFYFCKIDGNFHEMVLALCPKLKCLSIEATTTGDEWLMQTYPSLEQLEFISSDVNAIPAFLKLNPNVRKFGTSAKCLWESRHLLEMADVALDDLSILIDSHKVELPLIFRLLNEMHERGAYKRLHMYVWLLDQQVADQLVSLSDHLVTLYVDVATEPIMLPIFKYVRNLSMERSDRIVDFTKLVCDFTHLQRIQFKSTTFEIISVLMSRAVNLKKIKFLYLQDSGAQFSTSDNVFNLNALNQARSQLADAQKVTIYAKEEIYLATKQTLNDTDLELIRIRRYESFDWNHDFNYE